ncbi:MAG TPA: NAD(P)/FAD-dependent oxidoreductase [Phycisphaerae bacterium]|nr:NAD(P)/FAD-dependent oxidoreductase [Phycisphaerae bacterium]
MHDGKYDCIVVGGGPAGATCATILAQHNRRVLVLEKSRFPRHHIGESLMPHTYGMFERLGMLKKLEATNFPRKQSVQFVNATGADSQPFYFPRWRNHPSSTTWQVPRDEFDKMMLDNAREHGAEVIEGVKVSRVLFDGERAVGVKAAVDGETKEFHASVIVDATGESAILSRQLGIRSGDAKLKNGAIYGYFKGALRDEGENAGATIIIHMPDREGWFWYIPLPDDIASIGVVAPPAYLFTGRGDDPQATMLEEIARTPGIARRLEPATQIGKTYVTSDFSQMSAQIAGDGWVLIGDAFGFLDPVYSSGVMLALKSGEFAADAIHAGLTDGDVSGARLGSFADEFIAGMRSLKNLVYAFYDREFSFGEFAKAHPQYKDHLIRLLIGDVFNDEVAEIFDALGKYVDLPFDNLSSKKTALI